VTGRVSASFRQGIWMINFIEVGLDGIALVGIRPTL
jgi:hypothetical protein